MNEPNKTPEQLELERKLAFGYLDFLHELFPDAVKEWICQQYPHGDGLFSD